MLAHSVGAVAGSVLPAGLPSALKLLAILAVILAASVALAGMLVFQVELRRAAFADDDAEPPSAKTNCPACGARVSRDLDRCEYCDEPLDG